MLRYATLALPVLAVTATHSFAKWKAQYGNTSPAIQDWFNTQKNARGERCCDQSDGHPYFGSYRLTADGGVALQLKGRLHKIPSYMVLKGPNPTGHAVWWYLDDANFGHVDLCFAPGPLY